MLSGGGSGRRIECGEEAVLCSLVGGSRIRRWIMKFDGKLRRIEK